MKIGEKVIIKRDDFRIIGKINEIKTVVKYSKLVSKRS